MEDKKLTKSSHPFQGILGEDFNPKLFSMTFKNNFKWVILWSFLAVSIAYIYLHYTPDVFQASAIAMITTENKAKYLNFDDISQDPYYNISSEMELIRSSFILKRVIGLESHKIL